MDAQKIKFMMSIQQEIDKLEEKLGSNHLDVISTKALFQKLSLTEIKEGKDVFIRHNNCEELNPILTNTETIIDKVNRVTYKFDVIDEIIEKRALYFYRDFPTNNSTLEELKKQLTRNFELFELSVKKENSRLASKYLVLQIEGILNLFEQHLILFEENNPSRPYSQINFIKTHRNGTRSMAIKSKCSSIKECFSLRYVDIRKISIVIDIRDYESHQYNLEQIIQSEAKLTELNNNPREHYEAVFSLIKQCIPLINSLF